MSRAVGNGLAILLALAVGCATDPRPNSVAPPVLDPIQEHLEAVLKTAIESHGFPAAAAAVITSKDIRVAAMGLRRIDRPDRVAVTDRYGLGSNSKAVTATMLGVLVERGLLRWDLSLADALPDLAMRPEYRAVTLRQLLTHRAGIPPWTSAEAFARAQTFNNEDLAAGRLAFAAAVLAEPPVNVPGTETRYSNAGFSIAALTAERATHKSWRQLVTELVCEPLRISCAFGPPAATDPNQPWGHSRASGTGALIPVDPTLPAVSAMQGAGGLSLSIVDYAAFLQMHLRGLRGEDNAVLRAETVRDLHTPDGRYALGWGIQDFAGARSSMHAGGNGQFYALVAIQPERVRAVAFLTNDGGDDVEVQASALLKELLAGL
ncbi:MAG TPA: serine hydrolase domain-containing protein [Thermoanaerobaculia bacterium]|jgi:CubicO group peptidase (beta-lactamase class C family)|nr:serine hydrolase domain-containing protein [Thermoanaerobaculia bacterium]